MAGIRLAALVRRLRRGGALDSGGGSDADLLARFVGECDEAAFELLVWRHGGMVLAACQRPLGHTEDAEDAFQAVFLVLARKARTVRRGTTIPAWLHRVAVRVARRASAARRPVAALGAEPPARTEPDAAEQGELRGLFDAAIDRLSEPLRCAFVLCYLDGLSNAEAARELGCPLGTVESRLAAARRTLRGRLARQVTLPAGMLGVLGCQPVLSAGMVGVAAAVGGLRAAIGIVGEPAVRMAEGVLTMTNARMWFAVILSVTLLGAAGVGWASYTKPPAQPLTSPEVAAGGTPIAPPVAPPPKPAVPAAKDGTWPLAKELGGPYGSGSLLGVAPDGKSIFFLNGESFHAFSLVQNRPEHHFRSANSMSGGGGVAGQEVRCHRRRRERRETP